MSYGNEREIMLDKSKGAFRVFKQHGRERKHVVCMDF